MITVNTADQDEGEWGFGQVIALVLLIIPVLQTLDLLTKKTPIGRVLKGKAFDAGNVHKLRRHLLYPGKWADLHDTSIGHVRDAQNSVNIIMGRWEKSKTLKDFSEPYMIPPLTTVFDLLSVADRLLEYADRLVRGKDAGSQPMSFQDIGISSSIDSPNLRMGGLSPLGRTSTSCSSEDLHMYSGRETYFAPLRTASLPPIGSLTGPPLPRPRAAASVSREKDRQTLPQQDTKN
ncbi:hypothetical protein V5O48_018791, partial [Marasmius crinis-equi]